MALSLFVEGLLDPITMGQGYFDPLLVALSYGVAVLASYTTLTLANRVAKSTGRSAIQWLVAGSFAMGTGIWSMHFLGMLAFSMDMPFSYDLTLTLLSLVVGVLSSSFAIYVASRNQVGWLKLVGSGLFLGPGIAGMHYTGMAAMKMEATISYDPVLFSLSIVIAILASIAALWIATHLTRESKRIGLVKFGAALVMGIAICGMHYTGMAAAIYTPVQGFIPDPNAETPDHTILTIGVLLGTLIILAFTLVAAYFEKKLNVEKQVGERLSQIIEERTQDLKRQAQDLQESKSQLEKEIEERRLVEQEVLRLGKIMDETSTEIYLIDAETFVFVNVNNGACKNLGYSKEELLKLTPIDLELDSTEQSLRELVKPLLRGEKEHLTFDTQHVRKDGSTYLVKVNVQYSNSFDKPLFVEIVEDITERKLLESQLAQAQKLESIGQLAAGVAHEINTPIQYIGDNTNFLKDSFEEIEDLIKLYDTTLSMAKAGTLTADEVQQVENELEDADFDFLAEEIPKAIQQSIEGIERVAKIVRAMKEFSHPGQEEKTMANINKALETTVTVARNEWKYVADIKLDLDPSLPEVLCLPGELNQVFLNILVNAAHAITAKLEESSEEKGAITLRTKADEDWLEIQIQDTGGGIPEHAQKRVFDPFFTTKSVGKGTGQGLSIAYSVVVEKHEGQLFFKTEPGVGTTFFIRLPLLHQLDPA